MRFRTFVFVVLLVIGAVSVFGQIFTPGREGKFSFFNHSVHSDLISGFEPGQVSEEVIQGVRSTLNLSDAQLNALKTLLDMRGQAMQKAMRALDEANRKLEELGAESNPNPVEVGNAYLATRSTSDPVHSAEEKFRTDFKALLNPTQRATLDRLKAESEQINSLTELGLLERAAVLRAFAVSAMPPEKGFAIGFDRFLSNER